MAYHVYERKLKDDIAYDVISTYREPGAPKGSHPRHRRLATFRRSELLAEHADPRGWVEEYARAASGEEKALRKEAYTIDYRTRNDGDGGGGDGAEGGKCLGYLPYLSIYHELGLPGLVGRLGSGTRARFSHDTILQEMVYARLLSPCSKLAFYGDARNRFFTPPKHAYAMHDVYRCLEDIGQWREEILLQLDRAVTERYSRSHLLIYYDVTNYYFEIDGEDSLRARGVSKEHRPEPIIQMGLAMDEYGIPVTYELFRGNTSDRVTLEPMLDGPVLDMGKAAKIIVADKGMMSGDNIARIRLERNGYVISQSVRGADEETKGWALDDGGWIECKTMELEDGSVVDDWKVKERFTVRKATVSERDPATLERKEGKHVAYFNERQVCIYSRRYALRGEEERRQAIGKALRAVGIESADAKLDSFGRNRYLRKVPKTHGSDGIGDSSVDFYRVEFDQGKLDEDRKYDGYYIISTNVVGLKDTEENRMRSGRAGFRCRGEYTKDGFLRLNRVVSAKDIRDIYAGLWKIEETFKVTKTGMLHFRPVYHWKEESIRAHFLLCFIALVIERVLEHRMGGRYSGRALARSLSSMNGLRLPGTSTYMFRYYDDVLRDVGKEFGIDFAWAFRRMSDINSLIARLKKEEM